LTRACAAPPPQAAAWRAERGTVRKLEAYIDQICRELEGHAEAVQQQRRHAERLAASNDELEGLVAELRAARCGPGPAPPLRRPPLCRGLRWAAPQLAADCCRAAAAAARRQGRRGGAAGAAGL
jgi:hypothetical protein